MCEDGAKNRTSTPVLASEATYWVMAAARSVPATQQTAAQVPESTSAEGRGCEIGPCKARAPCRGELGLKGSSLSTAHLVGDKQDQIAPARDSGAIAGPSLHHCIRLYSARRGEDAPFAEGDPSHDTLYASGVEVPQCC